MNRVLARVRRELADRAHGRHHHTGMFRASDAVLRLAARRAPRSCVVLLLPTVASGALFAGVRTAIETAVLLAERTNKPLRVLAFDHGPDRADAAAVAALVTDELGAERPPVEIDSVWTSEGGIHEDDLWVATYWTTAHALQVAVRSGVVARERVVSLVQDHEPSFFAASTESAAAAATYHAGFHMLVNTRPLQRFLAAQEGITVPDRLVFGPALDLGRLESAAARRAGSPVARIGFYGRPSKPRNAYRIGVAGLRVAASELDRRGVPFEMTSMGEHHRPEPLPAGSVLRSEGRLPWHAYFERLATTDVLLSLQMTPHPSHPPLDIVASGGTAVTNDVLGTRTHLHERLLAVRPDPESIGDAVAQAAIAAVEQGPGTWSPDFIASLGRPLSGVVDTLVTEVTG